jgi:hypothetical protein
MDLALGSVTSMLLRMVAMASSLAVAEAEEPEPVCLT